MKTNFPYAGLSAPRNRGGFTLIEMLVVIAIIGILAAMIVPLAGIVSKKRIIARAQAEIGFLDMAINSYKAKKGFFPPDNPNGPAGAFTNQLFYELWGMIAPKDTASGKFPFTNTFNANDTISTNALGQFFGVSGIVNASADTNEIINFVPSLKAASIQNINSPGAPVWVFASPSTGPVGVGSPVPTSSGLPVNVFRYVSSNPTNNSSTFDLWVDVIIAGKTNRISNWNKDPEIVGN